MKRAIGFNLSQYGDLVIGTVTARAFKQQFPDYELEFGIASKYQGIAPLFFNHPDIDKIHIWEGCDDWPNHPEDSRHLNWEKYDIVFHAMAPHTINSWYNERHFTQENCLVHGLNPPENLQCFLNKWFDTLSGYENYVALSVFPGYGVSNGRTFSVEKLNELVEKIHKLGLKTIVIGTDLEPKLIDTKVTNTTFFNAVKIMLSCKILITADTAMSWVASAYDFPTIGFYTKNYFDMKIERIQSHIPVNPRGHYLAAEKIDDIEINNIVEILKEKIKE